MSEKGTLLDSSPQHHKPATYDRTEADVAAELTEAERSQLYDSKEVARYV